jgi:hypothetical protein
MRLLKGGAAPAASNAKLPDKQKANYETNPTSILFSTNQMNRGKKIGAQLSPRGTNGMRLRCD